MSFRNPNMSQGSEDFQGLKDATSEADYSVDGVEEKKDKKKGANKFLFKKDSKDKGYASLTGYTSQESIFLVNTKESKKSKPDHKITSLNVFKKSFKEEKRLKEIKETKEEPKRSKKNKDKSSGEKHVKRESLFGSHLENAVASFPCNDGVRIPYPIRVCMDIIEQRGSECENLYRHVTNKSHAENICNMVNKDKIEMKLDELNAEPNLACAVVKKFLKELKSPLIPDDVLGLFEKFESAGSDKESQNKIEHLRRVVAKLPQPNLDTVSYLIMHFHRVINNVKNEKNRVEINIFVQKFLPVFRLKERLFKFWISNADLVFKDYRFKKYKLKSNDETISRFSFLPDSIEDLEQEIAKQEIYLSKLHTKIANEQTSVDNTVLDQLNEELWGLQRYITSLKRKVKKLKQERKAAESEQIKNLTEAMSENNATSTDDKVDSTVKTVELTEQNIAEMSEQEILLVCENSILLESIAQMLEKISQERLMIQEYQQKIMTSSNGANSLVLPIVNDGNVLTEEKLYETEQLLVKENRLLEERINLIKKRINAEKEKIAELKLNIKLKSLNAVVSSTDDHSAPTSNISQIVVELSSIKAKDLVTTKL